MRSTRATLGVIFGALLLVGLAIVLATALPAHGATQPALAGLTTSGSIYVQGTDGTWHEIDADEFAVAGYNANSIVWSATLPGVVGSPIWVTPLTPTAVSSAAVASGTLVEPMIGTPKWSPAIVRAGKVLEVSFPVLNASSGAKLTGITMMYASPTIGGKVIRHVEHFANGAASVKLTVPARTAGKLLKVQLLIDVNGNTTTNTQTFTIS